MSTVRRSGEVDLSLIKLDVSCFCIRLSRIWACDSAFGVELADSSVVSGGFLKSPKLCCRSKASTRRFRLCPSRSEMCSISEE